MENREFKEINIDTFRNFQSKTEYISDDFIVLDNLRHIPYIKDETVKLDCLLVFFCIEGYIQIIFGGETKLLNAGEAIICPPNTTMSHAMASMTYKLKIIGFSIHILQQLFRIEQNAWEMMTNLHNGVILCYGKESSYPLVSYIETIDTRIKSPAYYQQDLVMYHLFSALLYEIMSEVNRLFALSKTKYSDCEMRRGDFLFKDFLIKLDEDMGRNRSVSYYANALFITPKHLSKIVKQATGKPALELINERAIEHIKKELKYSDKAVKEIAQDFNFTNVSFFGKFVKMHLGKSPLQFRNSEID